jgi:hypothetical protein
MTIMNHNVSGETSKFLLSDIQTRLAVIEEKQRAGENDRNTIKEEVKNVEVAQATIIGKVDEVLREFNQMKGKIGGVVWVLGALVTALSLFGDKIMNFLRSASWS